MKILYIHQYFRTPEQGGAIRSYYLAKGLIDNGYKVEIITAHNDATFLTKNIEGIIVHYLPVKYSNQFGFFKRIYSFIRFYFLTVRLAKSMDDIDIIYATSTPLTVGSIALRLKKLLGIPYYFEVRDLWPEAPIQMGVIKNPLFKKLLYWHEKSIYSQADKLIALSPGIRDAIHNLMPTKPIYIIPNMSDCSFFDINSKNPEIENELGAANKFVIGYFGAIGKVNNLSFFLTFINMVNNHSNQFQFIVIGEGNDLKNVKKKAKELGIQNIRFLPSQNKYQLRDSLSIVDAAYVSFDNKPVLESNSPNKYFDALASGKMIITNTDGWIREVSENHHCGIYANPLNPEECWETLSKFQLNRNQLVTYQRNARKLAENYYKKEIQIRKLIGVFNNEHHLKINDDSVYILTA